MRKMRQNSNRVCGSFHYSLKCARKSNHSVVHFVLFHEFEIVSNHMYGWNTDDDGIPTTYVVDLYIIE